MFAGAYETTITPADSQFLFGYPHVERYSEDVHDDLMTSALYLESDEERLMIISNDLIFVSKRMAARVRYTIGKALGIPEDHVLISATHTHSGPIVVDYASNTADPIVPKADTGYLEFVMRRMVKAALQARANARAAAIGFTIADSTGIGTNRRDPSGPSDHEVPVLVVADPSRKKIFACMLVVSMHPTVLHENSRSISADFPGAARTYMKKHLFDDDCVVLYHSGPCGNQSPRHVVRSCTFAEVERLGTLLGQAVGRSLANLEFDPACACEASRILVSDVPRRRFPSEAFSRARLKTVRERMACLRAQGASAAQLRTVECDIFGAEELVTLSTMAESGALEEFYLSCLPLEIQMMRIGRWRFIGWSGEVFVEFALAVKRCHHGTFIISLANGETQGYITTQEAAKEGGYEASNALFPPETGELLVRETERMLQVPGSA